MVGEGRERVFVGPCVASSARKHLGLTGAHQQQRPCVWTSNLIVPPCPDVHWLTGAGELASLCQCRRVLLIYKHSLQLSLSLSLSLGH